VVFQSANPGVNVLIDVPEGAMTDASKEDLISAYPKILDERLMVCNRFPFHCQVIHKVKNLHSLAQEPFIIYNSMIRRIPSHPKQPSPRIRHVPYIRHRN
jgi:hypothetical protein